MARWGPAMRSRYRRLTMVDRTNLAIEAPETPMHIGALAVAEAGGLLDESGQLRLSEVRRRIGLRLSRTPELRRRVCDPGLFRGAPLWVDDPDFAIERHVRMLAVPPPGEEVQLLEAAASLLRAPLDRSRPLWELWFLTGLAEGQIGVLLKLHHAVADGLAAVALMSSLFDLEPDIADPPPIQWAPSPRPSDAQLFLDAMGARLSTIAATLRHPAHAATIVLEVSREALATARGPRAPRTSLNRPTQAGRLYRTVRFDLAALRVVAHAREAKVNDVVLTIVVGGLRDLLVQRGEQVDGVNLQATVPVGLRSSGDARELGNAAGAIFVPLPLGERDELRRLDLVAAATRAAKAAQHPTYAPSFIARLAASGLARPLIARQRLVNIFVTNVPGPPVPIYVLGSPIVDVMPISPLSGNVTVTFGAFSYCGRLVVVVVADAGWDDLDVLVSGLRRAWTELEADAGLPHQSLTV
jgi:diacylglycerol O-acyltransferase